MPWRDELKSFTGFSVIIGVYGECCGKGNGNK